MKSDTYKRTLLVITAVLFSVVTCMGQNDTATLVVGTWIKATGEGSATFTITSENKYQVEFTGRGEADVWGSYVISDKQITFTDEGGEYSSDEAGVYEFIVEDKTLSFTAINDPVYGRSMLVEGSWSKDVEEEK